MEEFSIKVRHRKTLRTKMDVVRAAVGDPSICEVTQISPRVISLVGKRQGSTEFTFWFRDGNHEPVTCPVRVGASSSVPRVAFRVRVAEVDGASLATYGGPGAEAFVHAEAGSNPVVLNEDETGVAESVLRGLEERHALRVLGEPTLVTTDGRPAIVVVGNETGRSAAGSDEAANASGDGFRALLTLVPRVSEGGDIRLRVATQFRHPQADSSDGQRAGPDLPESTTTNVRLREGQTLVIGSAWRQSKDQGPTGLLPTLWRSVAGGARQSRRSKLVVLVTPQRIDATGSQQTASLAILDAANSQSGQPPAVSQLDRSPAGPQRR